MTYGFTAGGGAANVSITGTTHERFDDDMNIHTFVRSLDDAVSLVASYSLGDYGFVCGGNYGSLVTTASNKRYDSLTDSFEYRQQLILPRFGPTAYSMAGYGFTTGGAITTTAYGAVTKTERFDDSINTAFSMADLLLARWRLGSFSLSSMRGYAVGGWNSAIGPPTTTNQTERFDYIVNTYTVVAALPIMYANGPVGYSLHDFGYSSGGGSNAGAPLYSSFIAGIFKYDGTNNTWTKKRDSITGRLYACGYVMKGYGYTSGGNTNPEGNAVSGVTDRYDDNINTVVNRSLLNVPRMALGGYSIISPCTPLSVGLTI